MPIAAEMDIFEREIRGDDQLFSTARPQHGAVIADAESQDPVLVPALAGAYANGCNQLSLARWLGAISPTLGLLPLGFDGHSASIPWVTESGRRGDAGIAAANGGIEAAKSAIINSPFGV
jgi:hypothetical protein